MAKQSQSVSKRLTTVCPILVEHLGVKVSTCCSWVKQQDANCHKANLGDSPSHSVSFHTFLFNITFSLHFLKFLITTRIRNYTTSMSLFPSILSSSSWVTLSVTLSSLHWFSMILLHWCSVAFSLIYLYSFSYIIFFNIVQSQKMSLARFPIKSF